MEHHAELLQCALTGGGGTDPIQWCRVVCLLSTPNTMSRLMVFRAVYVRGWVCCINLHLLFCILGKGNCPCDSKQHPLLQARAQQCVIPCVA